MEEFLRDLRRVAVSMYNKLQLFVKEANPATLQLTGLLGVAAVLAGVHYFRNIRRQRRNNRPPRDPFAANARGLINLHTMNFTVNFLPDVGKPSSAFGGVGVDSIPVPLSDLRAHLTGIKTVTISAPGVLLEEWDPEKLDEGATIKHEAAEIVKELAVGMHVYILAHVKSDVGETAIRAALESAELLGPGIRQLPSHRLVFCETLKGKVSLVRQIEPQLHVDGSSETLEELQRFIPHMYQIVRKGHAPASCKTSRTTAIP